MPRGSPGRGSRTTTPPRDRHFDDALDDLGRERRDRVATESARTLGTIGTVVGTIGVAAIGSGIYLWLRSPTETRKKVTVVPHPSGLALVGQF